MLDKAIDVCQAAEAGKVQKKVMVTENQQSHDVNFLRKKVCEQSKVVQTGKQAARGQHCDT